MSPRSEPARPIKKIRLKITLEGASPSMARASKTMKRSKLSGDVFVTVSQTSEPEEAIEEIKRLGEALKETKDSSKDFK
jgi:hypothetical protein